MTTPITPQTPSRIESTLKAAAHGALVIWSFPEVRIPYATVQEIAAQTGMNEDYIPAPPDGRSVWEKVTNCGARGLRITVSDAAMAEIKDEFRVEPQARLYTTMISRTLPLVRHLVAEVVVPGDRTGDVSRIQEARNQRKNQAAYILKYFAEEDGTNRAEYLKISANQYINGEVDLMVDQMKDEIARQMGNADAQDIRYGIRAWLEAHHRTMLNRSGGVYFVPYRADTDMKAELDTLRDYINACKPYAADHENLPTCIIIEISAESDGFYAVEDILRTTVEEIKRQMAGLRGMAGETATKTGKRQGNLAGRVRDEWSIIQEKIQVYQQAMGLGLKSFLAEAQQTADALGNLAQIETITSLNFTGPDQELLDDLAALAAGTESLEVEQQEPVALGGLEIKF